MLRGLQESSEESEGDTSAEDETKDEHDMMDTTPVRDISTSPEKTARRVMTVRYMLGELKTLLANQGENVEKISHDSQTKVFSCKHLTHFLQKILKSSFLCNDMVGGSYYTFSLSVVSRFMKTDIPIRTQNGCVIHFERHN